MRARVFTRHNRIQLQDLTMLGPRDENTATTKKGRTPTCIPTTTIVTVGFGSVATYKL